MQLSHELPDYAYTLRAASGRSATVNDKVLDASFIVAPDRLLENWPVAAGKALTVADLEPVLALGPEVILLGTGDRQVFPSAQVLGYCLSRGVGLEVMTNPSAASTYNVLAGEGRKVAAAFMLAG